MVRVFISYVKDNLIEVQKLAEILRIYDIDVWLDSDKIKAGYQWKDEIRAGISEGDFFIACFSSEYQSRLRSYMNEELTLAIEELRLRPTNRAWFIPVLLSNCDIPDRDIGGGKTLRSIQWVNLYENWHDGVQSILSVIQPDSPTIYKLTHLLKSDSARVRIRACDELGNLGRLAEKAVPFLVEVLNDENETVCASAANALGSISVNDEKVIAALLSNLQNRRDWLYCNGHAINALARLSELEFKIFYNPELIPTLINMVTSRSKHYLKAGEALGYIKVKDINVYIEILKGIKHQDKLVRNFCLKAAFHQFYKNSFNSHDRDLVIFIPDFHDPDLVAFIPDLIKLLDESNPDDFRTILSFLQRFGKAAVPALIMKLNSMNDEDWENRCAVISVLGEIGDPAAIPALTKLFNDTWPSDSWPVVSFWAKDAVRKLEQ